MAQLKETRYVIRALGIKEFSRRVWQQAGEDDIFTWAASLAYSWMFALFPFLIFLLTLVPLLPSNARLNAKSDIRSALKNLPKNAAEPIQQQADDVLDHPRGGLLSVGLLITVWAASGGMSMTMQALDRCYDIKNGRPYIEQRFVAILLTIIVATLIILVMVLMPIASGILAWLRAHDRGLGPVVLLLDLARFGIAMFLLLGMLALVYRWGVSIHTKFHFLTPGAVFSLAVWVMLAFAFRFYINRFGAASYNKTYGAVAGVAILLLFFYIDASVLLIGAEINSEVDFAMLGLPSSDSVTVLDIPERAQMSDERLSLMKELKAKRALNPPTTYKTPTATTLVASDAAADHTRTWRAVGALATAGAAWAFFKALRQAREAAFEKERLKQLHPLTYNALFEHDGK